MNGPDHIQHVVSAVDLGPISLLCKRFRPSHFSATLPAPLLGNSSSFRAPFASFSLSGGLLTTVELESLLARLRMTSPARSSASATSAGQLGNTSNAGDDNLLIHFPSDLISAQDRKEEALIGLKADVMAALQKEVKSLDEDSWKFTKPRSQIHLISRPGSHPIKKIQVAER